MYGCKGAKEDRDVFVGCLFMNLKGNCRIAGSSSVFILALILSIFLVSGGHAAVSISIPSAIQGEFISNATNQYNATITPGLFAGDYRITITSKKTSTPPPPPPLVINNASAFEALMAYGVGNGMEYEREDDINLIYGEQAREALGRTCGGFPISTLTSTTTVLNACVQAYNVMVSTISQRWGMVFNSTGGVVAP